ncbi:MAG: hypothetical protein PUE71_03075 [Clostridia bacterium]|nr:hypothetical protein [Clostridia bacterium]
MSLISKLFGGKAAGKQTDAEDTAVKNQSQAVADTEDAGCTTTEESAKLYAFAKANASKENTEKIFAKAQADSYYVDSEKVKVFPERIMDFGFDNPAELEAYLMELWKDDKKMQELIPVIKVATFKNRDKYDSKYKDLSLYNYTL